MKDAIKNALSELREHRAATWTVGMTSAITFAIVTMLWVGAFNKTRHEIEIEFDAQAAPSVVISDAANGHTISDTRLRYENTTCHWDVQIDATGRKSANAWDAQVWVQKISTNNGDLGWDTIKADAGWEKKDSIIGAGGKALVSYGEGHQRTIRASADGSALSITFSRHQWTGIMRVTVNGETREIDTWRESFAPETLNYYAPPSASDRLENCRASVFVTPSQFGPSGQLKVGSPSGKITLKSALFNGRRMAFDLDGTLHLPSRFRLVWIHAIGLGIITALAIPLLGALLWIPVRKNPFWYFVVMVVLVKLWMIGGDEMRANPYDARGYMLSSLQGFWGAPFDAHSYDRQPGYPLLISAGRALGIPLRVWLELFYCGACLVVATSLPRIKLPRWSAAAAFALMVFNPVTLPVLAFGFQDVAYTPFFLAFLGCLLHAIPSGKERAYACIGVGLTAAFVWNTRPEHTIVACLLTLFFAVIVALNWATSRNIKRALWTATKAIAPTIVIVAATTLLICATSRTTNMGAFATSNFQLKGFTSLYDELLAIEPESPESYHPIPTDVRLKAYAASPTFATLRNAMEGPTLDIYRPMSEGDHGVTNDFGVFAFWGLRLAPWYNQNWQNADQLDRFYQRCANELRAARESGAYESRTVFAHFVDPRVKLWMPHVGEGMAKYWGVLARSTPEALFPEDTGADTQTFDSAALRRASLVKNNQAIWTTPPNPATAKTKQICAWVSCAVTWTALILVLPAAILLIIKLRRKADAETMQLAALLIIVVAAFASRFMLMSVMHAVAFEVEPRYILPVAPLLSLLVVVFVTMALVEIRRGSRGRQ